MSSSCPVCKAKIPWYGLRRRVVRQDSLFKLDRIANYCRSCNSELKALQSPFMKWAAYAAFFIWFGYQLIEMFGLTQVKAHLWYWPHAIVFLLFMVILCSRVTFEAA
jgi:hypothetical protein